MVAEHPFVNAVHPLELVHVGQEHADLEHMGEAGTGCPQDGVDVPEALLRLRLDIEAGEVVRAGPACALAGDEDEALEYHRRRIGPGRDRSISWKDRAKVAHPETIRASSRIVEPQPRPWTGFGHA